MDLLVLLLNWTINKMERLNKMKLFNLFLSFVIYTVTSKRKGGIKNEE